MEPLTIQTIKGNDEIKSASDRLQELNKLELINYYGYIEGNDISLGKTNVVVTDGFTGNIGAAMQIVWANWQARL